ncbi:MAG: hypothetical protein KC464_28005 [Myxococcales bacterium]|nr:hypothetical protein [Myxococcales bacterium]
MPDFEDFDRFRAFWRSTPSSSRPSRASWSRWLERDGDFDLAGAEPVYGDDRHLALVWLEEHYGGYEVYLVPRAEVDVATEALHRASFGVRAYNDLDAPHVIQALRLVLRASFEPEAYFDHLADLTAAATARGITLPDAASLRPEVGRWHRHAVADGAGLARHVDELCAVRFLGWR